MSEEKTFWDNATKVLTAVSGFLTSIAALAGAATALYKLKSSRQTVAATGSFLQGDAVIYISIIVFGLLSAGAIAFLIWRHFNDAKTGKNLRGEKGALAAFIGVNAEEEPKIRIVVPTRELTKMLLRSDETIPYEVNVIAEADVHAAFELNKMLFPLYSKSKNFPYVPEVIFIDEARAKRLEKHTLFLVGGPIPNRMVGHIVKSHRYISCKHSNDENGEKLFICSKNPAKCYHIHPASEGRKLSQVESEPTYGCVLKDKQNGLTRFAVWGLDEKATFVAARWLATHWKEHLNEDRFVVILHIPAGALVANKPVRVREDINLWIPENPPTCNICHSNAVPENAVELPEN